MKKRIVAFRRLNEQQIAQLREQFVIELFFALQSP